jgi:cell division protein FtsI (penicillin-binding protein 3)
VALFRARVVFIVVILAALSAGIVARLFYIQLVCGRAYAAESRKQAQQRLILLAKRGEIRDRKGRVLSASVGSQMTLSSATLEPQNLAGTDSSVTRVAVKRLYPFGDAAGAVLGCVGKDGYGLGGAEFYFEKYLKGENGWAIVMRDGKNRKYPTLDLPRKPPQSGCDLYLTLDIDIQKIAENVIRQAVENYGAKGGMCIVMEPATGKLLAMVNDPPFNPNMPLRYSQDARLNKCIGYTFEPGSTFKAVTAACALQEKVKKETDTLDGNFGVFMVYKEKIRDEKPFGKLSFTEALAYSSNVCFAKIANDIGNERLYKYARDFGFGERTGIQLPGEEAGTVHPIDKWSGRTRVTMAIGQEVSVTLLQMALVFSAIANGGVLAEPRMYEAIRAADGSIVDSTAYQPVRRVISADVARRLTSALCGVVTKGTGVKAAIPGIAVAGKTGTAQKIDKETGAYSNTRDWASFIWFAPADCPLLLCAVVIDEPLRGETGGFAAAPAFQKIMSQIISHPQLEFAEKMLGHTKLAREAAAVAPIPVPDLNGMASEKAESFLKSENIPYECIGGKGTVAFQEPPCGGLLSKDKKLVLYTSVPGTAQRGQDNIAVPNCLGKDLRDAVNAMNLKGLTPYVLGAGTVIRQNPSVGNFVHNAEPCTLVCSFGDVTEKL